MYVRMYAPGTFTMNYGVYALLHLLPVTYTCHLHLSLAPVTCSWYHGDLTRREAKCILMDYDGGNGSFLVRASESYHGKFAISFV